VRILVLTFYFEPDLCAGSFRTTPFVEELKNISMSDDKIDVITTMPNRYGTFNTKAKEIEKIDNVYIDRIDLGTHKSGFFDQSLLFGKFAWNVLELIKNREKYDIVYATSSRLMTAFLGALISNRQKAKLYLDIRDIFTDTLESVFKDSKLRYIIPIFKKIENYTIKSAKHINIVSKGFEQYFKYINPNCKYSFYTNGIDDIFLDYDFSQENKNEKQIITYAGNIGEGQGLEKIIHDMAKKLGENYLIQIIGDGGRKKALIESVEDLSNVKLINPVSRDELLSIYKKSDILFLHLNNYEAFKKVLPSKIFEYAITDKFIIAGVGGYAAEFIEQNISDAIVFEPCNIGDFYSKFRKIKSFRNINRREFSNKFNRKSIMKLMADEVYKV